MPQTSLKIHRYLATIVMSSKVSIALNQGQTINSNHGMNVKEEFYLLIYSITLRPLWLTFIKLPLLKKWNC